GTTTVEMGSETLIGTCAIMEPPPQLHPAAANANPRKATHRTRRIDRNMECMRDSPRAKLNSQGSVPGNRWRNQPMSIAIRRQTTVIISQLFWPHQGWGANRC